MKLLKTLALLIFIALIASCGSNAVKKDWNNYVAKSSSQYKSGSISALTYYTRLYNKVIETDFPVAEQKSIFLDFATTMLFSAEDLSDNKITEKEFIRIERRMKANADVRQAELEERVSQRQWEAIGELGRKLQEMDRPRTRYKTNCTSWGNNINCTTY